MPRNGPSRLQASAAWVTLALVAAVGCGPAEAQPLPAVRVTGSGEGIALTPSSYCWTSEGHGVCADGPTPADPPNVGSPDEVEVSFPLTDWGFVADFLLANRPGGRCQRVALPSTGDEVRLLPVGPPATYDVTLHGKGPGGDLATSFRWTTTSAVPGPAPVPAARC